VALHRTIHRLLLTGAHRISSPAAPAAPPPAALEPLIEAAAPIHARFDARAIYFGDRYRSGFWAIYLLSAIATLCAVLPLALGWDSSLHRLHPYAGLWALSEVIVIGTVSLIYWQGHRHDWQGQWLRARTTAELCGYLPVLAPLLDLESTSAEPSWYARLFDADPQADATADVSALCTRLEPLARSHLAGAWADPGFVRSYTRWLTGILEAQRQYHRELASRQHSLLHRVHRINATLFGLTGFAALMHLLVHSLWLSLVTTFFPALGASLHGALAQSEAYRLAATSERLMGELAQAIERIHAAAAQVLARGAGAVPSLKAEVRSVVALLLEEHQDWHLMVRPHHLPLG
jgi:hypothetical protein